MTVALAHFAALRAAQVRSEDSYSSTVHAAENYAGRQASRHAIRTKGEDWSRFERGPKSNRTDRKQINYNVSA